MRVTFLNDPQLAPVGDGDVWRLLSPFVVEIREDGGCVHQVTVPAGTETDLASVPRLPGAYLLFANRGRRAAILHDYLYETRRHRRWADAVFKEALKKEGVGGVARFFMWLGVRMMGSHAYERVL